MPCWQSHGVDSEREPVPARGVIVWVVSGATLDAIVGSIHGGAQLNSREGN